MKPKATLQSADHWLGGRMTGIVSGHPRLPDGRIFTSSIRRTPKRGAKQITTRNTVYRVLSWAIK